VVTPALDLLQWRPMRAITSIRGRRTLQTLTLAIAALVVAAGLLGPPSAPRNLATVLTWIHFRGLLIVALLAVANLFCAVCPMMLVRDLGRRIVSPTRRWPVALRNKWMALALLGGGLFVYEYVDLWSLPRATALIVLGYFGLALLVDLTFSGASFCKFVCPIGQFNFISSTLSPFEVQVRDRGTCDRCRTADCLNGRSSPAANTSPLPLYASAVTPGTTTAIPSTKRRGCELGLFLPAKVGNLDCTFCLDCVRACPSDNIGLVARAPAAELSAGERRSGIGRLIARRDIATLIVVFTFGAMMNAFAMTGTAAHMQHVLMHGTYHLGETWTLAALFTAGLIVAPGILLAISASATRFLASDRRAIADIATRYAYALVPLGAGIWLAHFGFHALTGALTIVPVAQATAIDLFGRAWLGAPRWSWTGIRPGLLFPAELGCIVIGAFGSFAVAHAIANHDERPAVRSSLSWHGLILLIAVAATWTLLQPMAMRGMVMPG
jgi:polyferredoxin